MVGEVQPRAVSLNTIVAMAKPTRATPALVVALAAATITVLAGCGGGTQTVSASSEPQAATETNGTTGGTGTKPSTATTKTPATVPSASTSTPAATRTAPEPAFAEAGKGSGSSSGGSGSGGELAAAEATVRGQGYTVDDQSDYKPGQTLRVLIGTGEHSNDGYDKRAFFFVDSRYIGTDAGAPSAQVSVAAQSDTEVVLAYALYKPGNPLCCPAGGQAKVRFQLNNGQLTPLDPIPPVNSTTGTSRQ
jgi:hypothetical protein